MTTVRHTFCLCMSFDVFFFKTAQTAERVTLNSINCKQTSRSLFTKRCQRQHLQACLFARPPSRVCASRLQAVMLAPAAFWFMKWREMLKHVKTVKHASKMIQEPPSLAEWVWRPCDIFGLQRVAEELQDNFLYVKGQLDKVPPGPVVGSKLATWVAFRTGLKSCTKMAQLESKPCFYIVI